MEYVFLSDWHASQKIVCQKVVDKKQLKNVAIKIVSTDKGTFYFAPLAPTGLALRIYRVEVHCSVQKLSDLLHLYNLEVLGSYIFGIIGHISSMRELFPAKRIQIFVACFI